MCNVALLVPLIDWGLRDYGVTGQLGLEKIPEEYVEKMVAGFREVKRVLRKDGTLWLNLGDSYGQNNRWGGHESVSEKQRSNTGTQAFFKPSNETFHHPVIKQKDLIGIPWRVAFALQSDGWYLRQDIIWAKPNPMPESVTDRCTKSHEYIFLLTKSAKYFYDNEAIKEDSVDPESYKGIRPRTPDNRDTGLSPNNRHKMAGKCFEKRNRRSVWDINTNFNREAHFATFPPEIPRLCISAGSKKGDTILDPFCGSGTTGEVALKLDRNFIGIELNQNYVNNLIIPRLENVNPLFRDCKQVRG